MSAVLKTGATGPVLRAALAPRGFESERLLVVRAGPRALEDRTIRELPELLSPGDLLVVNDAATLPASLRLQNFDAELRLIGRDDADTFRAVAFGAGDYRTPTELRPEPPPLPPGTRLEFGRLSATVVGAEAPRLLTLRFDRSGAELWAALYRVGRAVQYSYVERPLELWDVQNRFAARPWASELPSAGRPLSWGLISRLRRRGIEVVGLTHAAGLSSTGSAELDRRLPLPEWSELPEDTLTAIQRVRKAGGNVVAVGTTVVRALEDRAAGEGSLTAGTWQARLVIGPGFCPRVVTALLTGLHEPTTSHFLLMQAFAPAPLLERATVHAARAGYLQHEFGDSLLLGVESRSGTG
jgi:S-adenosylmethionine:tRNA ribosyltransferase-isomerase